MILTVEYDKPPAAETIFSFVVRLLTKMKGNEVINFRDVMSIPMGKVGRAVEALTPLAARGIRAA